MSMRVMGFSFLAAAIAAAFGFLVHVYAAEIVNPYVASVMSGRQVTPSWDVRVPAALSSIEQGVAVVVLYFLLRASLPSMGTLLRGVLTGMLVLALGGQFVRQPLMNFLVGNPVEVVVVQGGAAWLVWLGMGLIAAIFIDITIPTSRSVIAQSGTRA